MPWPKPRCGFGSRVMSNVHRPLERRLVAVGRALPEQDLVAGLRSSCPRELGRARRGAPLRRRRRRPAQHLLDRRRQQRRGRRAARASWSGRSISASSPPAIALRVVSEPAANSSEKNDVQLGVGELRRVDVVEASRARRPTACRRSGRRRFAAISSAPYAAMRCARRSRRASGSNDLREPWKSKPGSTASNSQWRSSSGTPSRMQIICIGSSAATSTQEVERARRRRRASSSARVRRRSSSSSRRTVRGVRPALDERGGSARGAGRPSC